MAELRPGVYAAQIPSENEAPAPDDEYDYEDDHIVDDAAAEE